MTPQVSNTERLAFALASSAWTWAVAWFYHAVQIAGYDHDGWLRVCWFAFPCLGHTVAGYVILLCWFVRLVDASR